MTAKSLKILFAGGGTGGHLFSGIALAEEMREQDPKSQALFVGTPWGLEKNIVPQSGFPLEFIQASPLKGSSNVARVKSLLRLPKAYFQSKKILKRFQPDCVIGIGGYASGPMVLAAHFSKIPTTIIEQNSIPGFTNRRLARFIDKVFLTFENAKPYFDAKKTVLSGNPTRKLSPPEQVSKVSGRFCVFIMGGSQGAHALNQAMVEALPALQEVKDEFHFIHQSGQQDYEGVQKAYSDKNFSAEVFPFSSEIGKYYAQADFMICRAGAGTITELQNKGMASLLVPYPFAADDHQLYNAKEMVESGAADLVLNQDLNGEKLAEYILTTKKNPARLALMRANALKLSRPQAAKVILRECSKLII